jgi:hypothetical protein
MHYKSKWNRNIPKQCKTMIYKVYFKPVLMPKETYGTLQSKTVQPGFGREQKEFGDF